MPSPPTPSIVVLALLALGACAEPRAPFHLGWDRAAAATETRCQAGTVAACGDLGRYLVLRSPDDQGDFRRGLVLLEVACGAPDQLSCVALGLIYARSHHDSMRARARDLLSRSCETGTPEACTALQRAFPDPAPVQ